MLLKNNGQIVDPTGKIPYFKESTSPVQLAVQHRNHLGIISNPVASFSGATVTYDFTTGLAQAYNSGGDPAQQMLKNGEWCMVYGDINSDFSVDAIDITLVKQLSTTVFLTNTMLQI
ncbi:MAG: hypothetical protein IPK46_10365 [Saprospiraceae bacterium]|nr:hypothetical protein [Saprospiraceae bacterium]